MSLQVYSTLSRKKEPFHKQPGERVTMYVCGPTVYKPSHIGHMVGPVIFDTVKRYLTYLGYPVTWVVNITDVDDKLIKRAGELNTTVPALAEKMTADYLDCLKKLNVTGIDLFPKATDHIPGMIAMMERLIAKGVAYASGGDVYFDVSKDADYGKLCNRDAALLEEGAEKGGKKRNPGDFALWKGAKPDEPPEVQYDSPWGKGRPGWHIECSVMSQALLGDTLDIHGGGLDLKFPHHENELAQSESDTGREFAHVWMHNGLLSLRDKEGKLTKMAGSLGNVLNVVDALKHLGGPALRFFFLGTHYRSPIDLGTWDWTDKTKPIPDGMVASKKAFDTFVRFAERVKRITGKELTEIKAIDRASHPLLGEFEARFRQFMDDDFNTGGAVGVVFELVTFLNKTADAGKLEEQPGRLSGEHAQTFADGVGLFNFIAGILGLTFTAAESCLGGNDQLVSGLMQLLIDTRAVIRAEAKKIPGKDDPVKSALFKQATDIREGLAKLGVIVEDRPTGTTWRVG